MADIDGMTILDSSLGDSCGAAFYLAEASSIDSVESVDDWEVRVKAGSRFVVAHGPGPSSFDDARNIGLEATNKALDLMALRAVASLKIAGAVNRHIVCWTDGRMKIARLCAVNRIRAPRVRGQLTVRHQDGSLVPPSPPKPPPWHEALPYLRACETTDDLFDAFRSANLALEALLASSTPWVKGQREKQWLESSIEAVSATFDIAPYIDGPTKTALALAAELRDSRNAVFHAKDSFFVSANWADRDFVSSRLRLLKALCYRLYSVQTGFNRPASGVAPAGAAVMLSVLDPLVPFVGDEESDGALGGSPALAVQFPTEDMEVQDEPFLRTYLAKRESTQIRLPYITHFGATLNAETFITEAISGLFALSGISRLEIQLGLRITNYGPREEYLH